METPMLDTSKDRGQMEERPWLFRLLVELENKNFASENNVCKETCL
jgi:hypothetical protein